MANWSRAEVEATVADYLVMLDLELRGERYNKTQHRRDLQALLSGRSDTAIERKHENISAVLIELGFPYIDGYKPLGNYQQLLHDVVASRLAAATKLENLVKEEVDRPVEAPESEVAPLDFDRPPALHQYPADQVLDRRDAPTGKRTGRIINYLAREARNASLGAAGERFALRFEIARLQRANCAHLARRVEHVSATRGDGLGFDILSYEEDERERYIEVKTTAFGRLTPFFVTRNELRYSLEKSSDYHLYRVFSFRRQPRLFSLDGRLDSVCHLDPVQWMARVS